jgi:arsenate reductase
MTTAGAALPCAVATGIAAADWFIASPSFANPAATRARALTNTSAGIRPGDVPGFVVAQIAEAAAATLPFRWLVPSLAQRAQLLITMGCEEQCPVVPGLTRDDWPLQDPKGRPLDDVRRIRDEIRDRVTELVDTQGWRRSSSAS